jgi:hypothetical protein
MTMPKPVLITTAIIVFVPDDDDSEFEFVEPYAQRLREAIQQAFQETKIVDYPASMQYEWIDGEDANVGRCAKCGCWVTDYTREDELKGLPPGRVSNGQLLCDECETFGDELDW